MRSRAPLALMEQLVMILVFALAAALCLQVFVFADRISARNEETDRAVLVCQNAAETLKAGGPSAGGTSAALEAAGLTPLSQPPFDGFCHWVEQAVERDAVLAIKP